VRLPRFKAHAVEKDHDRWVNLHETTINGATIKAEIVMVPGGKAVRIDIPCKYLGENGHCSIYGDRPNICRMGRCIKNKII
jgi:Fe-S-cluster containining protein